MEDKTNPDDLFNTAASNTKAGDNKLQHSSTTLRNSIAKRLQLKKMSKESF